MDQDYSVRIERLSWSVILCGAVLPVRLLDAEPLLRGTQFCKRSGDLLILFFGSDKNAEMQAGPSFLLLARAWTVDGAVGH
jgi:hypothetical protein